jgi:hypothetical protein
MPPTGRTPRQLGEPPDWLDDLDLPLVEPAVTELFQSHTKERGPLNFNPTPQGRFNAPNGEHATTYLSTSPEGAFVETFVQDAGRSTSGQAIVTRDRLDVYCLCRMPYGMGAGTRALHLVDLSGPGVVTIGATGELCALADIARLGLVQRWALRLYQHRDRPDGIYYRARHDPSRFSIALFDRARGVLTADCSTNILIDPARLASLLNTYRVGLA